MGEKIDKGKIIFTKKLNLKKITDYKNLRTKVLELQFLSIYESIIKIKKSNFNLKKLKEIKTKSGFYFKPINDHLLNMVKKKIKNDFLKTKK